MRSVRSLRGASAAVTGAGRGIGRAIALDLARAGARVAVGDVEVDAAEGVAREIGSGAFAFALDVTDPDGFRAFLDEAERRHGPLALLVNNAGVDWIGPFHEEPDEVTRSEIEVNLYGTALGSKLALARMLPRGEGHIVNVASAAGRVPLPGTATYSATKHGVVGLTESLRLEYRGSGVAFTVIQPAQVETAMVEGQARPRALPVVAPEEVAAAVLDAVRRRRFEVWVVSIVPRRAASESMRLRGRGDSGAGATRFQASAELRVGRDLSARNPDFIRRTLPTFRLLSQYFRPKVRGLEHIPSEGPVLLVGNHSGGTLIADTFAFAFAFYSRFGAERRFYQLAHDLALRLPGVSAALRRYGVLPASPGHAERALDSGAAVLVYPGGDHESHRPSWESGNIDFGGRSGFIRLALKNGVPIVPVVAIGGQETALFLTRGERGARALGLDRLLRLKVLPLQVAPPWGLTVLDLPGRIPLPSQLTIQVLPPVELRNRFGRHPDHQDIYDGLTDEMQLALDELGEERDLPVVGKVGRRSSANGVSEGGEPWPGYDRMSVPEIEAQLRSEGNGHAAEVRHYEQGRKRRKGVIEATERG